MGLIRLDEFPAPPRHCPSECKPHPIAGATAIFAVLGAAMIAVPIAALGANGISWMLPPVRSANLHAMAGLQVSFGGMNKRLLLFGAMSAPLACIELALAVVEPWAR